MTTTTTDNDNRCQTRGGKNYTPCGHSPEVHDSGGCCKMAFCPCSNYTPPAPTPTTPPAPSADGVMLASDDEAIAAIAEANRLAHAGIAAGIGSVDAAPAPSPSPTKIAPQPESVMWQAEVDHRLTVLERLMPGKNDYRPTAAEVQTEIHAAVNSLATYNSNAHECMTNDIADLKFKLAGLNKRVNNTPASAVEQAAADIERKWAEMQRMMNTRFQAMSDHIASELAAKGSVPPSADAAPSPNINAPNYADLQQQIHEVSARLSAYIARQQQQANSLRLWQNGAEDTAKAHDRRLTKAEDDYSNFRKNMQNWKQKVEHAISQKLADYDRQLAALESASALYSSVGAATAAPPSPNVMPAAATSRPPMDAVCRHHGPACPLPAPDVVSAGDGGWVKCSDRLPTEADAELLTYGVVGYALAKYLGAGMWKETWDNDKLVIVTHWRKLPPPPAD